MEYRDFSSILKSPTYTYERTRARPYVAIARKGAAPSCIGGSKGSLAISASLRALFMIWTFRIFPPKAWPKTGRN